MAKRELTIQSGTNLLGDETMKLSDDDKINMMYVQQIGDNECWFASYMMVLTYITGTAISYDMEKDNVKKLLTDKALVPGYIDNADYYFTNGGTSDTILLCLQSKDLGDLHYNRFYPKTIADIKQQIEYSLSHNAPVILGLNNPDHYVVVTAVDTDSLGALTIKFFDPYNHQDSPNDPKTGTLSIKSNSLSLHYTRYTDGKKFIIDSTIGDLISDDPNKK